MCPWYAADFTPVCTTELGSVAKFLPEFAKRGVKVAALSCDSVDSHKAWTKDVEAFTPGAPVSAQTQYCTVLYCIECTVLSVLQYCLR